MNKNFTLGVRLPIIVKEELDKKVKECDKNYSEITLIALCKYLKIKYTPEKFEVKQ